MSSIINSTPQLNNEEMDLEFQEMREYDELIQAIVPASPPTLEDLQQEQQEQEQPAEIPQEEGCQCACCRGTCACGRGHACDEEEQDDWHNDWYYSVHESGLDWNEGGYYD